MTIYKCKVCNYKTSIKTHYDRHIKTKKHKQNTINKNIKNTFACSICSKKFKYKKNYIKHYKIHDENLVVSEIRENKRTTIENGIIVNNITNHITNNITNNIVKNYNTNNFSINVFLNDDCKNAMNIEDFTKKLHLSINDLMYSKDNGYVEGITNILNKKLSNMTVKERPMHCWDKDKLLFYIKKEDTWLKDNDNKHVDDTIYNVQMSQVKLLKEWENKHPNYLTDDDLLTEWKDILKSILVGDTNEDIKDLNKQIKIGISKNIDIKEEIKQK
tara:strand:+ start:7748 stop:8566 length:819 start_codon:yes stop_codon:yes gene_type:complete